MHFKMWLLTVLMVLAGVALAAEEPNVEYSADSYLETAYGVQQGLIYVAPGVERREFNMDGMQMINIIRHDEHVIWSLMPEQKTYMEMKITPENSSGDLSGYQMEMTRIGPETVNGVHTTKNKLIMTGPNGVKMGGFSWITDEGIVVKMDAIAMDKKSKERLKIELKDLKIGHVDPALFKIPDDYTKMDMMSGIGKAMFGGDDDDGDGNDNGQNTPPKEKKKGFGFKDAIDLLRH